MPHRILVPNWAFLSLLLPAVLFGDSLPRIEGENLAGKAVVLPDAASGRVAILVAGFSHASQNQTKAWSDRLDHEFTDPAKVTVYPVAVLEAVPRLVRGMAVHGIKSGAPKEERERFLLVFHKSAELKQAAGFERPDDAYLILVDATGAVRWRFHGSLTDSALMQLEAQVQSIESPVAQ